MITIEVSSRENNGIDEISHGSKENGKGQEIKVFTLIEECNYEPRIIEDNLIMRKRKAKKSSK